MQIIFLVTGSIDLRKKDQLSRKDESKQTKQELWIGTFNYTSVK